MDKRKNVWLAVSGIVEHNNQWLVVKKKYGGLKGKWSFPAGFVEEGETIDEAVKREVFEETGIVADVSGIAGIRSGVIRETISDNMIVFMMKAVGGELNPQESEISEVSFQTADALLKDRDSSLLIRFFLESTDTKGFSVHPLNPGDQFSYTSYKIFNMY
ncbi:NUDIX domain-containing protein [Alkalihalobacillus sp. AL-G]|uniref:NUDIX domain-containing protein n=1 Tax=Alkalihalobacillus sp. AL-G TaxID=2926399 RepID=UPI00272C38CD|nr:NUDIX hydrolase [Alkalihalobacillus sp. AL-G]WLD92678.1 NUDIX hydrolase [Alkalihalobacillus sp. AL-G]